MVTMYFKIFYGKNIDGMTAIIIWEVKDFLP